MKIIFIILISIGWLNAVDNLEININLRVEQNIKALYKDVDLTAEQKKYIEESEEVNINEIKKILIKEASNINIEKNANEKNVVEFELDENGEINNIELILKSSYKQLDKTTKLTIEKANNKLLLPKEKTRLRYIFRYDIKNKKYSPIKHSSNKSENRQIYQNIARGTTNFKYDSKEYTREFDTNKDGFINVSQEPNGCAKRITILTENGMSIAEASGSLFSRINKEAPKGKYRILVQTKQDCKINLHYE